ncbi:uncharacterized protein [Haliotis asinina]|uniref:uncharacterized protein isoform X1 n=1 Tax=Haliotis asinina TaxID=109174 RepID=UPI003531F785
MSDDVRKKRRTSTTSSMSRALSSRHRTIGVLSDEHYGWIRSKLEGVDFPKESKTKPFHEACRKIKRFNLTLREIHNPIQGGYRPEVIDAERKIVIRKSDVESIIAKFYKELRGSGAKKIKSMINEYYAGISKDTIQDFIDRQTDRQQLRPAFSNAPNLKPVISKKPMGRHQVDLVDLSGMQVTIGGETFLYVLSVIDVFTRFLWLRPLSSKSASSVAIELYRLYFEYGWGCPRILQCDQGTEFKGAVNQLCMNMGTKIVRSRSHHPQSQGKRERSHRDWKAHLEFDYKNSSDSENFNWVEKLPAYARIHNESHHSSLGCSPYQAMFGFPPVHFQNLLKAGNSVDAYSYSEEEPSELSAQSDQHSEEENIHDRIERITNLRRNVFKSSMNQSSKMVRKHRRRSSVLVYEIGEKVLVKTQAKDARLRRGGYKNGIARCLEGLVSEIDSDKSRYKISFPNEQTRWVHVSEITSLTREKEKKRKKERLEADSMPDAEGKRRSTKTVKTHDHKGKGEQSSNKSGGTETQKGIIRNVEYTELNNA